MAKFLWQRKGRGPSRGLLWLGLALLVGVGGYAWYSRDQGRLTIENRSDQAITRLDVTYGDQRRELRNLASGSTTPAPLPAKTPFAVEGQLADGTMLRGRFGAVDEGKAVLTVMPGGVITYKLPSK